MLKTGEEHLASLRDGRRVYIGGELVDDVTQHPAFRNAAASFAMLYNRKAAPENRDIMSFEEDGQAFSTYFLMPRTEDDLAQGHAVIVQRSDLTDHLALYLPSGIHLLDLVIVEE